MRSPDPGAIRHPSGRTFEDELSVRYLSPGSFTIIAAQDDEDEDPIPIHQEPIVPQPFRLTPNTRKRRNQSFAIIAEPNSNPGSRSPSPSGRVSPFRGRGFNPAGSRHASPAPSPPPDAKRSLPKSQIPQYTRRRSTSPFGEKVHHEYDIFDNDVQRKSRRPATSSVGLSKSLSNISTSRNYVSRKSAFSKLSPIMGSSPEPSEYASNKSSPSKIPRSKSQPPSRIVSPNGSRNPSRATSRADSRNPSRNISRNASRDPSRDPSPSNKQNISSNRTMSYRNVVSRVDSFHRMTTKGKVSPNKPPVPGNVNNNNRPKPVERSTSNARANIQRLTSVSRFKSNVPKTNENRTPSRNQSNSNRSNENVDDNGNMADSRAESRADSRTGRNMKSITKSKITKANNFTKSGSKAALSEAKNDKSNNNPDTTTDASPEGDTRSDTEETESSKGLQMKKIESSSKLAEMMAPSTTTIVSTTTSTVTQPLNIDAHLEDVSSISSNDKPIMTPSTTAGSGRNTPSSASKAPLSHTSSAASLGKSSQPAPAPLTSSNSEKSIATQGRPSARSRLSLKARSIISMGTISEGSRSRQQTLEEVPNKATGSSNLPAVETVPSNLTINNNVPMDAAAITGAGGQAIASSDAVARETNVKNNISKIISPDNAITSVNNVVQKSANVDLVDGRTTDVKPIRITVREKGADMEVQSGNVRLPVSATNGVGDRPNLPPSSDGQMNQGSQDQQQTDQSNTPKVNVCSRILASCRKKVPSRCCKKNNSSDGISPQSEDEDDDEDGADGAAAKGCFKCKRKKKKSMGNESVQTLREAAGDSADEDQDGQPKGRCAKCWDRLKCCRSNKVADASKPTGCCPLCRKKTKKDAFANRSVSMVGKPPSTGCSCRPNCQCSKNCCKNFLRKLFCFPCIAWKNGCKRKKPKPSNAEDSNRRASQLTQKKSMTSTVHPVEDTRPKLDISLVEHSSHMRGAIPILPVPLAWICLFLNVFLPGVGTLFSGLFCLCIGKPRFSPYDGMKQRIGAFLIDIIIAFSQFFTVLFCFVGWGWSIWWGVIMLKIARKYRRIKLVEAERERQEAMAVPVGPDGHPLPHPTNHHHLGRDLERGS